MQPRDLSDEALADWLEGFATLRPMAEIDPMLAECVRRLRAHRAAEALDREHDRREAATDAACRAPYDRHAHPVHRRAH